MSSFVVNNDLSEIPVIFTHRDFVIIEKPPGIGVHQEDSSAGIVQLMQKQLNQSHLWLVHRLDKITSGCLILAKTQTAASDFGRLFEQRLIQKYYLAITDKKPKKRQGTIVGDLKKVRDGKWILSRETSNPSVTHFFDKGIGNGLRLQLLKPYTGQTHQLRVVLNSLGATILGDTHYSGTASDRSYLHSWQIAFCWHGEDICVQSTPSFGEQFHVPAFKQLLNVISPPQDRFSWPDEKLNTLARKAHA